MKQETKDFIIWIKKQINLAKENCIDPAHKDGYPEYEADYNKAMTFLDSLPEIESKLCNGGYIQDRRGIPCCNGDKVRFEFEDKTYKENFIAKKYMPVEIGTLKYSTETKSFYIVFGPDNNGYDWIDWTTFDYGPKWFEKVE